MNFSKQKNLNPKTINFFALLFEDFRVHGGDPLSQGFWAICIHRIINQINCSDYFFIRVPIRVFCLFLMRWVEWFTGITILPNSKIGRRVRIWHHSGIIINAESVGDGVVFRQNTTIGEKEGAVGRPQIGDMVDIGCGAVVVGNIVVGSKSVIGANAVVTKSFPDGSVIAGVPARKIN